MLYRTLGILILLAALAAGWLWRDYQAFLDAPLSLPENGLVYELTPGSHVGQLATDLAQRQVLAKPLYLRLYARQSQLASRLRAGEYQLSTGMTPRSLLGLLVSGRTVQHALTLLEGWSFVQVRQAIAADPVLVQSLAGKDDAQLMKELGFPDQHPEGRFFPDTYRFPRGTTDLAFLKRAHARMQQVMDVAWAGRDKGLPIETPDQALVLASIIEKETGAAIERPAIAGVFVRRLQRGMRLQTDPTVIYGLGQGFDGNLRRRDLLKDGPYNTYTRHGLPPTPICMPGEKAILAALHPAKGKALYFVAKGDGSHQFSASLVEHNAAVRRYQLRAKK